MVKRVWIFKAEQVTSDEYSEQCRSQDFTATFIPVLDHKTESVPILSALLKAGPMRDAIHGLIITSQRSVEALREALESTVMDPQSSAAWDEVPMYIVGEKTAEKLRRLGSIARNATWTVANKASDLAQQMTSLKQLKKGNTLLFLAGDKRMDKLPSSLTKAGLTVREIRSYSTCIHPQLAQRLSEAHITTNDWVIYFSPSGVDYTVSANGGEIAGQNAKIAAIGPTTASHLIHLGRTPDVVAKKPDAVHLIAAMISFDSKHNQPA